MPFNTNLCSQCGEKPLLYSLQLGVQLEPEMDKVNVKSSLLHINISQPAMPFWNVAHSTDSSVVVVIGSRIQQLCWWITISLAIWWGEVDKK